MNSILAQSIIYLKAYKLIEKIFLSKALKKYI